MTHKENEGNAPALETIAAQLHELEVVLGPQVKPALAEVRQALVRAMAARGRGDIPAATREVGTAMERLSCLGEGLGAEEAVVMRALANAFRAAVNRGDEAAAKESAAIMMGKSGAVERRKP
jgi:hypothetical protein